MGGYWVISWKNTEGLVVLTPFIYWFLLVFLYLCKLLFNVFIIRKTDMKSVGNCANT